MNWCAAFSSHLSLLISLVINCLILCLNTPLELQRCPWLQSHRIASDRCLIGVMPDHHAACAVLGCRLFGAATDHHIARVTSDDSNTGGGNEGSREGWGWGGASSPYVGWTEKDLASFFFTINLKLYSPIFFLFFVFDFVELAVIWFMRF